MIGDMAQITSKENVTSFWQFFDAHPWIMIISFLVCGIIYGAIKTDMAIIEFVLNGFTPKKWRKKKTYNRRSEDDFEQKIVNK